VPANQFSDEDLWKAIILYGLNAATYKMALAKSLFEFARQEKTRISWDELADSFLNQYIDRIQQTSLPQQNTPHRRTVMERVVRQLTNNQISHQEAADIVATEGLNDVIPRFQNIGRNKSLAFGHFYTFTDRKELIIKESLLGFTPEQSGDLEDEFMARWSLLEGAFSINQSQYELVNDIRDIYLQSGYERTLLTHNISFLKGYQGNTCFYCAEPLLDDVHVDHVLPRQVLNHDEIWNLVLAHGHCNLLKSDRLVGPHFIQKLVARNENIMGSNHPWKHKISTALGGTAKRRSSNITKHYENTKLVLGSNYWGGSESYNPETDQFYRRLITVLNNPA